MTLPEGEGPGSPSSVRTPDWFTAGVAAGVALLVGARLHPHVYVDDAAITFRYVERFLSGHGLTYNDHERVLGTSNPLYTLLLIALSACRLDVETAALLLGLGAFAGTAALVAHLTVRFSGSRASGLLAGLALVCDGFYRYQSLSGMESSLSALLGLLTIAALAEEQESTAGVFLGLSVWNKLDAGVLAMAIALAALALRRRLPVRLSLISAAVVAPWCGFAWAYFGSPVPRSFVAKLLLQPAAHPFDHAWVWRFLSSGSLVYVTAGAAVAWPALMKLCRPRERLSIAALGGWAVAHAVVFSVMNLGDYYPWYLTVLVPPLVSLSFALVGRGWGRVRAGRVGVALALLPAPFLWASCRAPLSETLRDLSAGNPVASWEAFDEDRRACGVFLKQFALEGEVVSSPYGWPAYTSRLPVNDGSLLNSVRMLDGVQYLVEHGVPAGTGSRGPGPREGYLPLATFNLASDLYPGYSWFTVYGAPGSRIAQRGVRYLQYRLHELGAPTPYSSTHGLRGVSVSGNDLLAHPPSGATYVVENARQPVRLVFLPTFNDAVPRDKTDGVTFEVYAEDTLLYQRHVVPSEPVEPAIREFPAARGHDRIRISLITSVGSRNDPNYDWAIWRSVKVIVGSGIIDVRELGDPQIRDAWRRWNPTG